jgi:hypothetical protein
MSMHNFNARTQNVTSMCTHTLQGSNRNGLTLNAQFPRTHAKCYTSLHAKYTRTHAKRGQYSSAISKEASKNGVNVHARFQGQTQIMGPVNAQFSGTHAKWCPCERTISRDAHKNRCPCTHAISGDTKNGAPLNAQFPGKQNGASCERTISSFAQKMVRTCARSISRGAREMVRPCARTIFWDPRKKRRQYSSTIFKDAHKKGVLLHAHFSETRKNLRPC